MTAASAPARNSIAVAATVFVVISLALVALQTIAGSVVPLLAYQLALPTAVIGGFFTVVSGISGVISMATLVIGIVATTRPGGRARAGIAIGVGAVGVVGVVLGFLAQLVAGALY